MFTIWIYPLRVIITNKKYELHFFSSSEQEKHKILGESKFLLAGNYNKLFVQKYILFWQKWVELKRDD